MTTQNLLPVNTVSCYGLSPGRRHVIIWSSDYLSSSVFLRITLTRQSRVTHMRVSKKPSAPIVQIMACPLFVARPLSEPMMTHCQFDHKEWPSVKFKSWYNNFHSQKWISKCRLQNGCHFTSSFNVLPADLIWKTKFVILNKTVTAVH